MKTAPLIKFMRERHAIFRRRAAGLPMRAWTRDPILREFKFTNVYRELDRQTVWIRENVREPFADHPHLWFMLCVARIGCTRETITELMSTRRAWPTRRGEWDFDAFHGVLLRRLATAGKTKERAFYSAWQVNHHLYRELDVLWDARRQVEPRLHATLQAAHEALRGFPGWGAFMRYEVVCDLRHTRYLRDAPDVDTWTSPGPGSQRGLNRVYGRPLAQRYRPDAFVRDVTPVFAAVRARWPADWPRLELREIEHSLCEFDKYERARLGEGRPKQRFSPRPDPVTCER